jgi:hypothetical protein
MARRSKPALRTPTIKDLTRVGAGCDGAGDPFHQSQPERSAMRIASIRLRAPVLCTIADR